MEVKMVCLSFQRLTGRKKDIAHSHEPLEKKKNKKEKKMLQNNRGWSWTSVIWSVPLIKTLTKRIVIKRRSNQKNKQLTVLSN
jgi:hypothetical protein